MPTILVVDDQADAREMLRQFLSSCGFVVHTATDGVDAITVAQRVLPSTILMDLMMQRMDGFEATRCLKADTRTSAIPVIAFTASALTNGPQLARSAGCDHLLPKPCDLDLLADELRQRLTTQAPEPLTVEDAIAADIAVDGPLAAAIERRDRRADPAK